ncbi:MAG: hypothetical protein Q4Q07_05610 [Tissierellia bacterium]|nr:hypothetical protein [Tissierellia bacterium]
MDEKDETLDLYIKKDILEPLKKNLFYKKYLKEWEASIEKIDPPILPKREGTDFTKIFLPYVQKEECQARVAWDQWVQEVDYLEFLLRFYNRFTNNVFLNRNIERKLLDCKRKKEEYLSRNPIWYYTIYQEIWKQERQGIKEGQLIHTPYVKKALKDIINLLSKGEAVFLRGHLGSGKTEIAMEAAFEFAKITYVDNYILEQCGNEKITREKYFRYKEEALKNYLKEDPKSKRPFFIAGNKDIRAADLFTEKVLTVEGALSGVSIEDALEEEEILIEKWVAQNQKYLDSLDDKVKIKQKEIFSNEIRALYRLKHGSFGTKVEKISREVLLAILEGKPLIIDELNAISMDHLIGLNDLLQKKPGDLVYITGVGNVRIGYGFGLIATGNLSSESVLYGGTDELNPAFASRFYGFEYSYLPQDGKGSLWNQDYPENNELFRVLVSLLAEEDGHIFLPGGAKTMEKLFALCQYAKVTQDIFTGRYRQSQDLFSDGLEPELSTSVLSLRNLRRILDDWNLGAGKSLDEAIWDGFIRSVTSDDDVNVLMNLAMMFGFFLKSEGWNVSKKGVGESSLSMEEIKTKAYRYEPLEPSVYTVYECIQWLFGNPPPFKDLPEGVEQLLEDEKISPERFIALQDRVKEMEETTIVGRLLNEDDSYE